MVEVANTVSSKHAVVLALENALKTKQFSLHTLHSHTHNDSSKNLTHLSTRGAVPGSRGRHSLTRCTVMPVLSAEHKTSLTHLTLRLKLISLPQFCAGDHNVSCACIHEPEITKLGILPE